LISTTIFADAESCSDSDSDSDSDSGSDPGQSLAARVSVMDMVTSSLIVLGGVSISAIAMVSAPTIPVFVACGVCMVNAPVLAVTKHKVASGQGMSHHVAQVKKGLGLLQEEVSKTAAIVDDLQEEADCLEDIEQKLTDIAGEQGLNCDEIVRLVRENESILKRMKQHLRKTSMAEIARIVISCDKDADMTIDVSEVNELTLRITMALEVRGIEFDGDKFKAMVRRDNSVTHVLAVIGAIMFGETIGGKNVEDYGEEAQQHEALATSAKNKFKSAMFTLQPKMALTSGVDDVVKANRAAKNRAANKAAAEAASMFTMQNTLAKGSVAATHGRKISLTDDADEPPSEEARKGTRAGTGRKAHRVKKSSSAVGGVSGWEGQGSLKTPLLFGKSALGGAATTAGAAAAGAGAATAATLTGGVKATMAGGAAILRRPSVDKLPKNLRLRRPSVEGARSGLRKSLAGPFKMPKKAKDDSTLGRKPAALARSTSMSSETAMDRPRRKRQTRV